MQRTCKVRPSDVTREEFYTRPLPTKIPELQRVLDAYLEYYNRERPHRALNGLAPLEFLARMQEESVPQGVSDVLTDCYGLIAWWFGQQNGCRLTCDGGLKMSGQAKMHIQIQMQGRSEGIFEHAWKIHDYLATFIQVADNKAEAIIAIDALSAGLIALIPPNIGALWKKELLLFGLLSLAPSLLFALLVIKPRTKSRFKKGLIFWESIRKYDRFSEYRSAFFAADALEDVLKHNYELAEVAEQKYQMLRRAINWQLPALPVYLLVILLIRLL